MLKFLILRLIHFLLASKDWLCHAWFRCKSAFLPSYSPPRSHRDVQRDSKRLKKLPLHISFAVMEHDVNYHDLACLIVWSVSLGISFISLYDYNGLIKGNKERLKFEVCRSQRLLMAEEASKYSFHFYDPAGDERKTWSGENGDVVVCVLCGDDGREAVSDAARKVCGSVHRRKSCIEDFSVSELDEMMPLGSQGIVDPDMMIEFGPGKSLFGYPPWILRLTEIQSLYTHHNINYRSFLSLLKDYANCEQRVGK